MYPIPGMPPVTPLDHFPSELPVGAICAYAGNAAPGSDSTKPSQAWQGTSCSGSGGSPGSGCPGDGQPVILESIGWLLCDGRELSASEYPELHAALGYLYGGSGDKFKIPDYRGAFLRGVDLGAGVDPDASDRVCPNGGTSDAVGSMQCDALQTHTHAYSEVNPTEAVTDPTESGAGPGTQCAETSPPIEKGTVQQGAGGCDGTAIRLSSETRPRNIAVYFIIKYRSIYGSPRVGEPPFPAPPGAGEGFW